MGMYPLEELIPKWGRGELTTEQAIGQILLWLQSLERRVGTGERDDRERRREKGENEKG